MTKPLIEFVRIKKLAVTATRFGIAKRDNIKRGDNHRRRDWNG